MRHYRRLDRGNEAGAGEPPFSCRDRHGKGLTVTVLRSSAAPFLSALLVCLALVGCAGRPTGILVASATAEAPAGTSQVDLLVATTRRAAGAAPGELFTGERGTGLSYADISISIPPESARAVGEVQWPQSMPADPARDS